MHVVGRVLQGLNRRFHMHYTLSTLRREDQSPSPTVAWQHLGQHFQDTCLCCSARFLQANSVQEVPLLEPISHAVLQQDLSTQQPSAALFNDGVTSRHTQVPSNPNKLQHEVRTDV